MVWTTNNGIHFFRRPSQLHPSLFLSSWYSSSFARSRGRRAWAQCCIQHTSIIFQILFFMAVLVPLGKNSNDMNILRIKIWLYNHNSSTAKYKIVFSTLGKSFTPLTVRIDPREWTLHVDETVIFFWFLLSYFYMIP